MNATPANQMDSAEVIGHFINNTEVADDNRPQPVTNPATGTISKHVAMASKTRWELPARQS